VGPWDRGQWVEMMTMTMTMAGFGVIGVIFGVSEHWGASVNVVMHLD